MNRTVVEVRPWFRVGPPFGKGKHRGWDLGYKDGFEKGDTISDGEPRGGDSFLPCLDGMDRRSHVRTRMWRISRGTNGGFPDERRG